MGLEELRPRLRFPLGSDDKDDSGVIEDGTDVDPVVIDIAATMARDTIVGFGIDLMLGEADVTGVSSSALRKSARERLSSIGSMEISSSSLLSGIILLLDLGGLHNLALGIVVLNSSRNNGLNINAHTDM